MRHAVRFGSVLDTLDRLPRSVLLEVGPGSSLSSLARRHPGLRRDHTVLPALPHPRDPAADTQVILTSLGELWTAGTDIAWPALHGGRRPRRTQLPGYPFERSEFPAPGG